MQELLVIRNQVLGSRYEEVVYCSTEVVYHA